MIFKCGCFKAMPPTYASEEDNSYISHISKDTAELDLLIWDRAKHHLYLVSCKLEEHAHSREQSFMRPLEAVSRSPYFSRMMAAVQSFTLVAVSLFPQQSSALQLSRGKSMGFFEEKLCQLRVWTEQAPRSILFADLLQQMDLPLPLPIHVQGSSRWRSQALP